MVQCEMCGAETSSPTTIKVEGAKLQVCSNCTGFGTEVKTESSTSSTSTKYSTDSTSSSRSSGTTSSGGSTGGSRRRSDMFDDVDELATDYDDRIRRGREKKGLSQSELADQLNEKASLIRKLERGETLPSDAVQSKLEGHLEVSLTGEGGADETEWSGGSSTGSYTLGDVVKRKD